MSTDYLKTGEEWAKQLGHEILDHDGWRLSDGVDYHVTEIIYLDYLRRYNMCTVRNPTYTARRSMMRPRFFCIYKPDGMLWRVSHEDNILERMSELNGRTYSSWKELE